MTRFTVAALVALAACKPAAERRADSPMAQAIDTLKAAAPGDTLATPPMADSTAAKSAAPTKAKAKSTELGRDSAFGPPRNLPRLDTVRRRPPA